MDHNFLWYYWRGVRRAFSETWKGAWRSGLSTAFSIASTLIVGGLGTNAAINSNSSDATKILISVISFLGPFLVVFIPKVLYMPFVVYRDKTKRVAVLEEMMEPKVDLVIGKDRPFYDLADDHVVCRIGIKSRTSAKNLTNVAVHLDSTDPESGLGRDLPLHWKDDNETPYTENKEIRSGKVEYVDVLSVWGRNSKNRDHVSIQHITPGIGRDLYGDFHKLKIRIYADDMVPDEKVIVIKRDGDAYWFGYDGFLVNIDEIMGRLPNLEKGKATWIGTGTENVPNILGYVSGGSIQPQPEDAPPISASVLQDVPKKKGWEGKWWKRFPPQKRA